MDKLLFVATFRDNFRLIYPARNHGVAIRIARLYGANYNKIPRTVGLLDEEGTQHGKN